MFSGNGIWICLPAIDIALPGQKLREINLVIEQAAWGAFSTEFYPTYDFRPVLDQIKARQT